MKNRKNKLYTIILTAALFLSQSMTVFAVTESDVEAVGKETAAGNVFIWFLCAIAFLKISQKIDSFLSSLGINVGHTGGNMMAELMVAARGLTTAKNIAGGSSFRGGSVRMGGSSNSVSQSSFLSGGLAGAVGRQFTQSAMHTMTGHSSNPISRRAFESSVKKGGDFANGVTAAVAKGNIGYTGSMTGTQAAQALTSYMGQTGIPDAPSYSDVEIGGGRIMGTETSMEYPNGAAFGMRVQTFPLPKKAQKLPYLQSLFPRMKNPQGKIPVWRKPFRKKLPFLMSRAAKRPFSMGRTQDLRRKPQVHLKHRPAKTHPSLPERGQKPRQQKRKHRIHP